MFYFTEKVVNLEAWQLYLGNAFWTLFVGLVLLIIAKVLGMVGLESEAVDNLLSKAGQISGARNPQIVTGWLDIYKWPDRPLSIAYNIHKSIQTIKIKKGQPWYRLTFITPEFESVKLIRMYERCSFLLNTKNKSKMIYHGWESTRPRLL